MLTVLPRIISLFVRLLGITWRKELRSTNYFQEALEQYGGAIVASWHESLVMCAWFYRDKGYATLVSQSFDGELAARTLVKLGFRVFRGSSSRGGKAALDVMRNEMPTIQAAGIAVDGPRGPRHIVKPGVAMLSAWTGLPIIPLVLTTNRAWRLNSWDKTCIPKPFATIASAYGLPIYSPASFTRKNIETTMKQIEESLINLQKLFEQP